MVAEGVKVQTLETHFTEQVECNFGFSGDGVTDDEGVVESNPVCEYAAAEGVEEVEDQGFEVGACEYAEDGEEGGACVVEVGLPTGPIEELEAGEDVAVVGECAEDLEDEVLGEREVEGGECGGEVVAGGGEDLIDSVEEGAAGGIVVGGKPGLEGVGDVVLGDHKRGWGLCWACGGGDGRRRS